MADVTHLFGGKWSPPTEERIDPLCVNLNPYNGSMS